MSTDTITTASTFQIGTTYSTGRGDHFWTFTVVARTARFITIEDRHGDRTRVGVHASSIGGHEFALPLGSFSQAPVISAERPC